MAWDVKFLNGVFLPQLDWWLDAHFPVARSFVSHAHSDHTATHREIVCSAGTARLMRARVPGERIEHVLPFGQTEALTSDCTITLYPAGHIFGSAQALLQHAEHGRLLYTGDFKLRRGLSAEPCVTPATDVLIMETTFGRPHYVFPPTAQVLGDIANFCHETLSEGGVPVLFGYSLGKSQEILSSLAAAHLPVMLHPQTFKLTRIYEEFGIRFPEFRAFSSDEVAGHVVICPPQARGSTFVRQIPRARTAMITGWAIDPSAIFRYQCDAAFPLSDHADYPDLLKFVDAVKPQRVLTLHGFAREFAQTLRERGFDAWAIGEDNQLELGIASRLAASSDNVDPGSAVPGVDAITRPAPTDAPSADPTALDAFSRFAGVADSLKATTKKLEKIAILRDYLAEVSPNDAALAATFFTGRCFPQTDQRNLNLGWSVIKRAVLGIGAISETELRAAYQRFADTGEATAEVLRNKTQPRLCRLSEVADFFAQVAAARGPSPKLDLLRNRLSTLSAVEAKYLVKIITSDLRIGLKEGLLEEAIAAATGQPLELVREANMLSGDIAAVTRAACTGQLDAIELTVFHPLQFMLASPEPTAQAIIDRLLPQASASHAEPTLDTKSEAAESLTPDLVPSGATVWLEEKYDGIRCQLHKAGTRIELYSRDLNRITEQFPDLIRAAGEIDGDFIADGELLAWREGRALPFAELQKRLGRKGDDFFLGDEIPVSISCYDLLWLNGVPLLKEPLSARRERLAKLWASMNPRTAAYFTLAPVQQVSTAVEVEAAFLASRRRGNEGLMAKDPRSLYTPGRRGLAWLKLKKAYATLDVVVVGVEYGHGKRRGVLSDYTFAIRDPDHDRLLTVGKAYSGLTDVEIAQLTQHFLENTLEERGRYRTVIPDTVLEIAFDTIQPSARHQSGYALRFPRIARIRTDKTIAQIDTLETCRRLASAAAFGADASGVREPTSSPAAPSAG
jgi:DNA ligase-1